MTPCIACGAPVNGLGAGHDPGCPVMVTDTTIAADMARAAIDNRETWAQGGGAGGSQLRSRINGAPLYIMARATVAAGQPIYAADDAAPED